MAEVLLWWLAFEIKHFLADFLFQSKEMGLAKGQDIGWKKPLAIHCLIQVVYTCMIMVGASLPFDVYPLLLVEYITHFVMDRIKAHAPGRWGDIREERYWWLLGFDQMFHRLVYLYMTWIIVGG